MNNADALTHIARRVIGASCWSCSSAETEAARILTALARVLPPSSDPEMPEEVAALFRAIRDLERAATAYERDEIAPDELDRRLAEQRAVIVDAGWRCWVAQHLQQPSAEQFRALLSAGAQVAQHGADEADQEAWATAIAFTAGLEAAPPARDIFAVNLDTLFGVALGTFASQRFHLNPAPHAEKAGGRVRVNFSWPEGGGL